VKKTELPAALNKSEKGRMKKKTRTTERKKQTVYGVSKKERN